MDTASLHQKTLLLLMVLVSLAFGWILLPFFNAIFWAVVLAVVFMPLHIRLQARWPDHPNRAALASLAVCLLMVILPLGLVGSLLVREAAHAYDALQSRQLSMDAWLQKAVAALPDRLARLLDRNGLTDINSLGRKLTALAAQGSRFLTGQAVAIGQNTLSFLTSFLLMLYLLFFLLRDGRALALRIRQSLPLELAHKQQLLEEFTAVIRATIKGNFVVALVQGALGGMIFAFLGIGGAALWGAVMGFLSLLPAIGTALVWVPVAIFLLLSGAIREGVVLLAFGVLVIGLVDNVLRPLLVGKDTRMPDYVVLVSTLGGLALFGLSGFIIGPVVAALFMALWEILAHAAPPSAPPPPGPAPP